MGKHGPKHIKKHSEGEKINDSFTLVKEIFKRKIWGGKPVNEYLWECKCDCGEVFYAREKTLYKRVGCKKCTTHKRQIEVSLKKYGMLHRSIKKRIFKEYKQGAEKRNLEFKLSLDDFIKLSEGNCHYCGVEPTLHESDKKHMHKFAEPWRRNGVDRVDTTKGYTLDNCVPCCSKCNYAKHDLKLDEFKEWIKRCYEHLLTEKKYSITLT